MAFRTKIKCAYFFVACRCVGRRMQGIKLILPLGQALDNTRALCLSWKRPVRMIHQQFVNGGPDRRSCRAGQTEWRSLKCRRAQLLLIGSAEALPTWLCVRCERDTGRERERERERETDVTSPLSAISLHFPLPLFVSPFTLPLSLPKWSPLWRWNSQWVHFFRCQNVSPSLFRLSQINGTSRATSDRKPKTNDQILPSSILSKKWIKPKTIGNRKRDCAWSGSG